MTYKTLATIRPAAPGPDAIDAAIAAAERWDAHLDVVCVPDPQPAPLAYGTPDLVFPDAWLAKEAEAELQRMLTDTKARLAGQTIRWTCRACPEAALDFPREIARQVRMADLILLPPPHHPDGGLLGETIFEALLFNTHVPVLIGAGESPVSRVTLAWDGSSVALAAVRAALPLLREADVVDIVTVDAPDDMAGHEVAGMLDRHGIATDIFALPRGGRRVSEILARHASETGAGLIVMGAYGHSRMIESAIGGVTRDLSRAVPVPLFLAR